MPEIDAHQGTRLPTHQERSGERVYKETQDDSPADRRRYRGAYVRQSGKVDSAIRDITTVVQDGVGAARPTGQHVATPTGAESVGSAGHAGPAAPDLVMGVAGAVAMAAEAVRLARRTRANKRRGHDGNG